MSVKDLIVLKSSMATNLSSGKYGPTLSKREITNYEKVRIWVLEICARGVGRPSREPPKIGKKGG